MKLLPSDWVGIVIGVGLGAMQPKASFANPIPDHFNESFLIQSMIFGLVGPPILALISKFLFPNTTSGAWVGRYVNFIFLIIAYGIVSGVVGLAWYLIVGGPKAGLISLAYFGCAGIGFWFAYLIHPKLAQRPIGDT